MPQPLPRPPARRARALALLLLGLVAGPAGAADKVAICHVPPGQPDRAQTLHVGRSAVAAHLDHGDREGRCDADETIVDPDADGGSGEKGKKGKKKQKGKKKR